MQFIDLKAQYEFAKNRIDKRIAAVLEHGHYIMGPEVSELEEQLAHYVGVKHAITCANGSMTRRENAQLTIIISNGNIIARLHALIKTIKVTCRPALV